MSQIEDKTIKNPRKGKEVYGLWLTKEEIKKMEYFLDEQRAMGIGQIILDANKRGDFHKR